MKKSGNKIKNILKFGLLSLLGFSFLLGGISYGTDDLLYQLTKYARDSQGIIGKENVDNVGKDFFEGTTDVSLVGGLKRTPSTIVKVTRLLLILVITLSVTMILWNGMYYIIQTGQGKEGKNLVKNIVYIVVGIIISLFSVIIITIIQSVPTTLEKEVKKESNNQTDNRVIEGGRTSWSEVGKSIKKAFSKN